MKQPCNRIPVPESATAKIYFCVVTGVYCYPVSSHYNAGCAEKGRKGIAPDYTTPEFGSTCAHVDLYYGTGKQAHKRALDIHHPGKLYLLLPKNDKKMVNP